MKAEGNDITLCYQVKGAGTQNLADMKAGQTLEICETKQGILFPHSSSLCFKILSITGGPHAIIQSGFNSIN